MNNTICPKCKGEFDSMTVVIKRIEPHEAEPMIFDCPVCGEEICDLECEDMEYNTNLFVEICNRYDCEWIDGEITKEDIESLFPYEPQNEP